LPIDIVASFDYVAIMMISKAIEKYLPVLKTAERHALAELEEKCRKAGDEGFAGLSKADAWLLAAHCHEEIVQRDAAPIIEKGKEVLYGRK
jgi:hypothetical protein